MKEGQDHVAKRFLSGTLRYKLALSWLTVLTCIALLVPWNTLVPDPNAGDLTIPYLPPFQQVSHLLGTDQLGRDVLALILHGVHTAWKLTFPPLLLATSLGVCLGSLAALRGNSGMKCSWANLLGSIWGLCILLYSWLLAPWWEAPSFIHVLSPAGGQWASILVSGLAGYLFAEALSNFKPMRQRLSIPLDELLLKAIDIWSTLPKLLLLLLLTAFSTPSLLTLSGWISLSYWVFPARLARTRVFQVKQETFVEAAHTLGVPPWRVMGMHIWPSISRPVITNFCFSASGLLGIGSTLAFLGIGIPADVPSWGKLISTSRYNLEAWWIFVFPSLFLLLSIFSLQTLGQRILKRD